MTFIPLLGYYLLRPGKPEPPIEERRTKGFTGFYATMAKFAIEHRWKVAIGSLAFLVLGAFLFSQLKTSFFPDDVQYWSYIDVWLPNDANFDATNQAAQQVEQIIREQADVYGKNHPQKDGSPAQILKYVTTWVGGGGPRFWFSVSPQAKQLNYAQVLVQLTDKELTPGFVDQVQPVLSRQIPGVRCDYRQLQTNPINYPVEIRVVSQADVGTTAERAGHRRDAPHRLPGRRHCALAPRGSPCRATSGRKRASRSQLNINPDRANLAGITNLDVANSATSAMSGTTVTTLQDGDKNIPVVARLQVGRARPALRHSEPVRVLVVVAGRHQDSAGPDLRHQQQHDDRPHHPHRSLPRDVDLRLPCRRPPGVGDHQRRPAQAAGVREDHAAGLQDRNRRRVQQAAGRLPQSDPGPGYLGARRFTWRCSSSSTMRSSRCWSSPPRPTAWPAPSSVCG